jgi:hypothetical protein
MLLLLAVLAPACSGGGAGGSGAGGASWHATALGSSWPVLAGNTRLAGDGSVTLELDTDGVPFGGYVDLDQFAPHARRWDGSGWPELGTSPCGLHPGGLAAVARLPAGDPVLVWTEYSGDAYGPELVRAARFDGSAWSPLGAPLNGAGGSTYDVVAASGPKGPVVAWDGPDATVMNELAYVARWDGASWVGLGPPRTMKSFGRVAVATAPAGDPVIAYVDPAGIPVVEAWNDASGVWMALPPTPATTNQVQLSLAVDGSGAVYVNGVSFGTFSFTTDAVYRLAPGAATWTSLGLPPDFTKSNSGLALAGLSPGGVAVAWTYDLVGVARWGGGWEAIAPPQIQGQY